MALCSGHHPRRNSLAFLAGVAIATTIGVTIFYLFGGIGGHKSGGKDWLDWVIIGVLVALALLVFLKRNEQKDPPKWMGKLEHAEPGFAARMGLLLYLLMPTDILTMAAVGATLARDDEPLWHGVGFLVATLLIAGIPLIVLLLLGRRAETLLPEVRRWMTDNSWIVNEAVILFFLALEVFG